MREMCKKLSKPIKVTPSDRYCIPRCVRLIQVGGGGGGVRVGGGVHDSYTFPESSADWWDILLPLA